MLSVLILYISGGTYSLTSTSNDKFLRNFFLLAILFTVRDFFLINFSWQFYLLSEFLPEIRWEEIAEEILAFRLISQHTTY